MANYPQGLAQDAVCQSHTGHMTGLWFLPARPLRLNTNEWMNEWMIYIYISCRKLHFFDSESNFEHEYLPKLDTLFLYVKFCFGFLSVALRTLAKETVWKLVCIDHRIPLLLWPLSEQRGEKFLNSPIAFCSLRTFTHLLNLDQYAAVFKNRSAKKLITKKV